MTERFTLLPDPRFETLAAPLAQRIDDAARTIDWKTLPAVLDPLMRRVLEDTVREAGGDEATIWLIDRVDEALVPAHNTGPDAARFVGSFRQPLSRGLVSMVAATEQTFVDNQVHRNEQQDRTLDEQLGLVTAAMIIVPFYFARMLRGVLSCVQLVPAQEAGTARTGFPPESVRQLQRTAAVLGRLIDHRLLATTVGWADHE